MPKRVFTTYQLADLLGATPGTVVEWMQKKWLPYERLADGSVRVTEEGLVKFLQKQGVDIKQVLGDVTADEPAEPAGVYEANEPQPLSADEAPTNDIEIEIEMSEPEPFEDQSLEEEIAADEPVAEPADAVSAAAPEAPPADETIDAEVISAPAAPAAAEPAEQIAQAALAWALERGAAELHFEPRRDGLTLRARIDGVLHERANFRQRLPEGMGERLIAYLKALAGLDIAQCIRPQAGAFTMPVGDAQVELELASFPTGRGEKLFIRIPDLTVKQLNELGLSESDEAILAAALSRGEGLVVLTGSARSGKVEAMRSMLAALAGPGRNVLAIEGATEIELDWVTHCPVGAGEDFTVAEAIRAAAGERPEVIGVDELADPAAASAALAAARAGGIVLAGMRATSPPAAIAELLAVMGLEPWPLAGALSAVMQTQTFRLLCEHCKQQAPANIEAADLLGLADEGIDFPVFNAPGCDACGCVGYAGTAAIFSVLPMNGPVVGAIRRGGRANAIEYAAQEAGMKNLLAAGLDKVRAGHTSLTELARVLSQ